MSEISGATAGAAEIVRELLQGEPLCLVDVGAADGLTARWQPIASALHVIAFEPDARSQATLDGPGGARITLIDRAAAAAEGDAAYYLTRKPRCSSLLAPNREVIDRFPAPERFDVVQTSVVRCTRIDTVIASLGLSLDFVKVDTQGSELNVLRGAGAALSQCLGVEVEVEFQPLYVGAALFRDIDRYVADGGFELYDLRRTFMARSSEGHPGQRKGQLVFGDALYFRPWQSLRTRAQAIKLALLMLTYGFADVVTELVARCPLVSRRDCDALADLCRRLEPLVEAGRKDRVLGTGLGFK